jgi:hypothetical protein
MKTTKTSSLDKYFAQIAEEHKQADACCGRLWVCSCGACKIQREKLKPKEGGKTND